MDPTVNSANMFENLSVITWRSRRLTPGVGRNEMWRDSMLPTTCLSH